MSRGTINLDTLSDIADAIRAKNGGSAPYAPGQMAAAIQNIPSGITPTGTVNITQNGTVDVTQYASAAVAVPNSYGAGDEGKVVSNGALVAQTAHAEVTQNGTIDTTLNNSVTVNVSGGGGSRVDILTSAFLNATGSVNIGQVYQGAAMTVTTRNGAKCGQIAQSSNRNVQFPVKVPKEATRLYLDIEASGKTGEWNLSSVHLNDTLGLKGATMEDWVGTSLRTIWLTNCNFTPEFIVEQPGITITVSTQYAVPRQVVVADISNVTVDSYMIIHALDCGVWLYSAYAE